MRILIGFEYSAIEREAFSKMGHDCYSCDILPSNVPSSKHLQCDIKEAIQAGPWDMIGLHPVCTAMALCGNSWYGVGMPKHKERLIALDWTESVWKMALSVTPKVFLEQPMSVLCQRLGKRNQAIHPWQFGHLEQKETWLWLRGLPQLIPTNDVYDAMMKLPRKERERIHFTSPSENRGHERSKAFPGIAKAMAEQWGILTN